MSNLLMILKTQNFRNDQRVLKEIKSLFEAGANINVFVSKNCNLTEKELGYPMKNVKILGGAAPEKLTFRIIGVLQFYIKCIGYIVKNKKKFDKLWVCDPIMFGLVLLIKLLIPNLKVVWDHHELPPKWFMSNKYLMSIFAKAYLKADVIIHANQSRCDYLENKLNVFANKKYIISNFPAIINNSSLELDQKSMDWINKNPNYIYLQNSLQDNRFGSIVIKKLIEMKIPVFHAGKIDNEYIKNNDLQSELFFTSGYLSFEQINYVLKKSIGTIIFYKKDSLNQIYCDANRLYQAMSLGVPVLIGDNPTLVESTTNYAQKVILMDENFNSFDKYINEFLKFKIIDRKEIINNWASYESKFREILDV